MLSIGLVLSVVYATAGTWIEHVATEKRIHSVAVDPLNKHIVLENGRGALSSMPKRDVRYAQSSDSF